jgi:hypothetical protein
MDSKSQFQVRDTSVPLGKYKSCNTGWQTLTRKNSIQLPYRLGVLEVMPLEAEVEGLEAPGLAKSPQRQRRRLHFPNVQTGATFTAETIL